MRKDNEHIEEKLIPYLEGVLNPKERLEVDAAINSDGELAREMSELRDLIVELRQGFACGLRPPQEDVSVDEVVELGANTGSVDSLPGTSQQKARLFCSDQALEEYSLLRALGEEMSRTTLDRDNIPEMPEALLKEFRALKPVAGAKGKVLAFDRKKLSPLPLWRRASGMLDRIDPKPLMASAAALVMLSLGVHLYRTPADSAAPSGGAEIGYNFSGESPSAGGNQTPGAPAASASPAAANRTKDAGVAVFTSDDRGLLKEQAEKLMANKVRYTVTKDRILVAEKDLEEARDILWADAEGKAVAMAKEKPPEKRMTQTAGASAAGGASPAPAPDEAPAYYPGSSGGGQAASEPVVINADEVLAEQSGSRSEATVRYYPPSPQHAPPRPTRPAPPSDSGATRESYHYQRGGESAPGGSSDAGIKRENAKGGSDPGSNSALQAKARTPVFDSSDVAKPVPANDAPTSSAGRVDMDQNAAPPEPTEVVPRAKPNEAPPPMSAERRQRLQNLAMGRDGLPATEDKESEGASKSDSARKPEPAARKVDPPRNAPSAAAPPPAPVAQAQVQRTETVSPARVAAAPRSAPVTGPLPNAITGGSPADVQEESDDAKADSRLAKMESSRQAVAQRNGVELSFESKNGKVSVYVRPKKTLTKAEMDALRKTLRKELGLADSDTIIIR